MPLMSPRRRTYHDFQFKNETCQVVNGCLTGTESVVRIIVTKLGDY